MSDAGNILGATVPATVKPIIPLFPYQQEAVESKARFSWNCWSRQVGKSFAFSLKHTLRAVETGRLQVLLSAGKQQSKELMEKVCQHAQAAQMVAEFHDSEVFEDTDIKILEVRLPNRGRVIGLPANPRTARGYTGDVFLDEFGIHQHDREIWGALMPTVLRGNSLLTIASTPKGKSNMFYRLRDNETYERRTVTLLDAISQGLEGNADLMRSALDDDELWRQEFLCEFVDEATAFLTYEMIIGCEDDEVEMPVALDGKNGSDPAALQTALSAIADLSGDVTMDAGWDVGRKRDLSVLWIVAHKDKVLKTRLVLELANFPFAWQKQIISTFMRTTGARHIAIDATGMGMPLAEEITEAFGEWRVDSINFATSISGQPVKEKLAGQLRVKVEDATIRIPASTRVRDDWHSIEKSVTTGGRVRYHAERSKWGHADRFWAAALAVSAATDSEAVWDGTAHRIQESSHWSGGQSERMTRTVGL